jgi:hypothetical protein
VPTDPIACQLVNVFGPQTPPQPRLQTSPYCRVSGSSFAKMLAAKPDRRIERTAESAHRSFPDSPTTRSGFFLHVPLPKPPSRGFLLPVAQKERPTRRGLSDGPGLAIRICSAVAFRETLTEPCATFPHHRLLLCRGGGRHSRISQRISRVRARMFALGRRDPIGTASPSIAGNGQDLDASGISART